MLRIDDIHAFWRDLGSNPSVKRVKYFFIAPSQKEEIALAVISSFFDWCVNLKLFCIAKCRFAFPARSSTSSLVRRRAWESRSEAELPCHSDQKMTVILIQNCSHFFIHYGVMAYHHRTKCGGYHQPFWAVYHHALACIKLRNDDIQCFALMIYSSKSEIYSFSDG